MSSSFELTLASCDIAHGLSRHVVQLFDEGAQHDWQAYDVPAIGRPVRVTFHVATTPLRRLCVHWYSDVDGAQTLIAGGSVSDADSGATGRVIDLCDVDEGTPPLGRLTVRASIGLGGGTPRVNPDVRRLIDQVDAANRRLHAAPSDMYSDARLLVDRVRSLPMIVYALHANDVRIDDNASCVALFAHLLDLALHFAHAPSQTSDACTLADMLTLVVLVFQYKFDTTYDDAHTPTDRWTSLLSFPCVARATYDCEDGAHTCLELFHAFTRCKISGGANAHLARIQALARTYTPYLAITELKMKKKKYEPHCMLVLLPGTGGGAITVEPTAFASGEWHARMLDSLAADRKVHAAAHATLERHGVHDDDARARMPLSMVRHQSMYGRILALMTCGGARAQHLLHDGRGRGIGVDACAFFLAPDAAKRELAIDMPVDTLRRAFATELTQMPASRLPRAPATPQQLPRASGGGTLVLGARADGTVFSVFEDARLTYIS
jgi:hypothetical protein